MVRRPTYRWRLSSAGVSDTLTPENELNGTSAVKRRPSFTSNMPSVMTTELKLFELKWKYIRTFCVEFAAIVPKPA
jgi:hypothetical protein